MGTRTQAWTELEMDEWCSRCLACACYLREPNGSDSSESVGTLILTNRRLVFAARNSA